jgi:hypothetical protein
LAAAQAHIAEKLGLKLLNPAPALSGRDRVNLKRRLKRQAQRKAPRIVNLKRARPWELEGVAHSAWFANNPEWRKRQLAGLRALLARGDVEAIAKVRRELALRVRTSRSRVLKEMQRLLEGPNSRKS